MARSRPVFSRCYAWVSRKAERRLGIAEHRSELLAGLAGTVVEVGSGNGLNFASYPSAVRAVLAVEPEPHLRAMSAAAAAGAPVPVHVVGAVGDALPLAGGSADAVVFSLVLCSVGDQRAVLAEAMRVLRPGGTAAFYEHVRSTEPRRARFQRAADLVWPVFAGGCHTARDTSAVIADAGFTEVSLRRLDVPVGPASPHILGTARRPI